MSHSFINHRPHPTTGPGISRRSNRPGRNHSSPSSTTLPGVLLACVEAAAAPWGSGALGTFNWPGAKSCAHNSFPDNGLGLLDPRRGATSQGAGSLWHAMCNGKTVTLTREHGFQMRIMRQEVTTTKQTTSERSVRGARVRLADRLLPAVVGIRRGVGGTHGRRMPIMRTTRGVHWCRWQADAEAGGRSVVDRHAVDSADMYARAAGETR